MTTDLDIRALDPAAWGAYNDVAGHAFGETQAPEIRDVERSVHEMDRSIAAYEGATMVGTATIYSFAMTVPGGPQPVAGVSWVTVLPSHRRRGVLSAMMRSQLHGLHEAQREPVAALWASEGAIYGRFGYGTASLTLSMTIPRSATALRGEPADPSLRVRLVAPGESLEVTEPVREVDRLLRPGMFVRNDAWQRRSVHDFPPERNGQSELRCALLEDASGVRAYARYSAEPRWQPVNGSGIVHVREAHASDPSAYAALWRYLTDLDLSAETRVRLRPVDDPLFSLLASPRTSLPRLSDALHVRLVDLDRALVARTYARDVDVVLEVRDPLCPWNEGRWRLAGGTDGATCTRTDASADLAVSATELGAAYLGGTSLRQLAGAGRVTELRTGALRVANAAFGSELAPWCPEVW